MNKLEIVVENKKQFRIELALAFLVAGIATAMSFSNYLFVSKNLYPNPTDFLGHMAKIEYIAQCLKEGYLPSWFPHWYNGTTVTQYYPPFSYYIIAPIYIITKNVMITFKVFNLTMLVIGGLGVWILCRNYIGKWCGLFGIIIFCWQRFILWTLFEQGQIAQGPIIALGSWYLVFLLKLMQEKKLCYFAVCILLTSIMILSHPNTIFMYCFCIMLCLLFFVLRKKVHFINYCIGVASLVFAGALTAFWSLVGVTKLENPEIPYVLRDILKISSTTIKNFIGNESDIFIALSSIIISLIVVLINIYKKIIIRNVKENYITLFFILLMIVTFTFSFGHYLPFFKFVPMADSMFSNRILTLTSIAIAYIAAYLINQTMSLQKSKNVVVKYTSTILCIIIIVYCLIDLCPNKFTFNVKHDKTPIELSYYAKDNDFSKGRYCFIGPLDSSYTYFPILNNFNLSEGFNVEGTIFHRMFRNQYIADASGNYSYMLKNYAFWNVRYVTTSPLFAEFSKELENNSDFFITEGDEGGDRFYKNSKPSSYFLIDKRDALVLGPGSSGIAIEFPYLVHDNRQNIYDYTIDELSRFKVIYICEPSVETRHKQKRTEAIIKELVDKGIKIIIEPSRGKVGTLFGVASSLFPLEKAPRLIKYEDLLVNIGNGIEIESKAADNVAVLFGLDKVYYKLMQNNGRLESDVIGAKSVGNGEVVFIGMKLSHYLKAVYATNWGGEALELECPSCEKQIKSLYEGIFHYYGIQKDFWPEPFPVENANWHKKGVGFEYTSFEDKEITVSLTYSPRWKGSLDGNPIGVGQKENLVVMKLPAGHHKVELSYGITKYGVAGYIISFLSLIFLLVFLRFYDRIIQYSTNKIDTLVKYIEI